MDEIGNVKERALEALRLGYRESLSSPADVASMENIGPQLDPPLHRGTFEDQQEFRMLARYLAGRGYIRSVADGFLLFSLTQKGRALVEGEEQYQPRVTSYTQNIGRDAYSGLQ